MKLTVLAGLLSISLLATASATPVFTDAQGREWLDLNLTRSRSWTDIATVCSALSGSCNGVLASAGPFAEAVDLGGYTWATRNEVRSWFYELSGLPGGSLDDYSEVTLKSLGYGNSVFANVENTISFMDGQVLNGWTRTLDYLPGTGFVGYLGQIYGGPGEIPQTTGLYDSFSFPAAAVNLADVSIGAYVYKQVPEPGTLILFASMLGLMGFTLGNNRRNVFSRKAH